MGTVPVGTPPATVVEPVLHVMVVVIRALDEVDAPGIDPTGIRA